MNHPYDQLVGHLCNAFECASNLKVGNGLSKGKIGEIMLAHKLGHVLVEGDKGSDGSDIEGKRYEYKVSHDNQFNFNFGHARAMEEVEQLVDRHFSGLEGAFCALMSGHEIKKIAYCPLTTLGPFLKEHLKKTKGKTFIKRFDPIEEFANLLGAEWVLKSDFHLESAPRRAAKAKKLSSNRRIIIAD